jgi:AraC-like DNA-binding protein
VSAQHALGSKDRAGYLGRRRIAARGGSADDMTEIRHREYAPDARLQPWVECLWTWRTPGGGASSEHRVLPDGAMDVLFRAEPGSGFAGSVVGTMTRPLVVPQDRAAVCVGVRFRSGRARRFVRVDASEIVDSVAPLEDVIPRESSEIRRQLADTADEARARLALERFLVERLTHTKDEDDALVDASVRRLRDGDGRTTVDELTRAIGVSRQHLTRLFRRDVGLGPKAYARVLRFRAAVRALGTRRPASLALLAADLGYCDQPHFTNEFRRFSGLSPAAWLAANRPAGDVPFLQDALSSFD